MTDRTKPTLEPWAEDRAIDVLAIAFGTRYSEAQQAIAMALMLTREEGFQDGISAARKINGVRVA